MIKRFSAITKSSRTPHFVKAIKRFSATAKSYRTPHFVKAIDRPSAIAFESFRPPFSKGGAGGGAHSPSPPSADGGIPQAKKKNETKNWELHPSGVTPNFWFGFSA